MTSLAELHQAVERNLASKRLGSVVFVRYLLNSQAKADTAVNQLALLADAVRGWTGQAVHRVYAIGSPRSGQVSLTVEFRGGATANITWTRSLGRGLGVDLFVLGNHGAMYHDAGTDPLWDEAATPLAGRPNQELVALIDRALRSHRPEPAKGD